MGWVGKEGRVLSFYRAEAKTVCRWEAAVGHTQSRQNTLSLGEAGHEMLLDPMPSHWEMEWGEAAFPGPPLGTHTLPLPRPRRASPLLRA